MSHFVFPSISPTPTLSITSNLQLITFRFYPLTDFVSGEFPIDAYIKFYDILVPIKGVSYRNVPIEKGQDEFTIEAHGNATLLIKSDKMGVNKLITDLDLKKAIDKIGGARG